MKNNSNFIALIPARGGSKGIHKKNMQLLNCKPLIHYTIHAAQKSKNIDEVYVSSDCNETLEYIDNYKNIEKIRRPKKYASDKSSANDVIENFVRTIIENIRINENLYIVYLQPTSPLRNEKHIDDAIKKLISTNSSSLCSVKESSEIPYKSLKIKNGKLEAIFQNDMLNANRQDLDATFYPNGAIYIFRISDFIDNNFKIPFSNTIPYVMSDIESIDIDKKIDLEIATNLLLKK